MRDAAIVSTARTGIGKAYRGAFNDTEAPVLSAHVVDAALEGAADRRWAWSGGAATSRSGRSVSSMVSPPGRTNRPTFRSTVTPG